METQNKPLSINEELKQLINPLEGEDLEALENNILEHGCRDPIIIWKHHNIIVDGHNRYGICQKNNIEFSTIDYEFDHIDDVKEFMVDNQFARRNLRPYQRVELILKIKPLIEARARANQKMAGAGVSVTKKINTMSILAEKTGMSHDTIHRAYYISNHGEEELKLKLRTGKISIAAAYKKLRDKTSGALVGKFIVPPFSVLDSRQGYWSKRKNYWMEHTSSLTTTRENYGATGSSTSFSRGMISSINGGVSIFDPVLAEVLFSWFCPSGGSILDPFAGSHSKAYVASKLGYEYVGIEFREDQVQSNIDATKNLKNVAFIHGDARNMAELLAPRDSFNFCCTSPPYYNLEVYSKDDASAFESYPEFLEFYRAVWKQLFHQMAHNSFVALQVGEIRNNGNEYHGFVPDTVNALTDAGFKYYNDIVLLTPNGTAAMRVAQNMKTRKIVKTHQNILVFYKGNLKEIDYTRYSHQLEFS